MWAAIGLFAKGALTWVSKNPTIFVTLFSLAAFVMIVVSKNSEISVLTAQSKEKDNRILALNAGLTQARSNVATLNETLKRQNLSIVALQKQGESSVQKFDSLMSLLADSRASTARKLDAIDKAQPGADKCASALSVLKGAAK